MLRACLESPGVTEVRAVVRRSTGVRDPKLREIIHDNYLDYSAIADAFAGVDACFFCLGISVTQVPDRGGLSPHPPGVPDGGGETARERRVPPRSFTT